MSYLRVNTFLFAILIVLTACSDTKLMTPETEGEKLQILYNDAMELVKKRDFVDAAALFEDIERQYPYSKWSNQAQLMSGFCYYKSNMYNDSLDALERFIALYPGSSKISYAYYLRALNYFQQISDVERDQTLTSKAKHSFNEVINKFPDSKYAKDSRNRLLYIKNMMARNELYIAKYYVKRNAHIAAIERVKYLLTNYNGTPSTEDALLILIDSYNYLNMNDLAIDSARVLKENYPEYTITNKNGIIITKKVVKVAKKEGIKKDKSSSWFDFLNIYK